MKQLSGEHPVILLNCKLKAVNYFRNELILEIDSLFDS